MPANNKPLALESLREALDRALSSPNGVRIRTPTRGKAVHLRQRLYKTRAIDRENSMKVYDPQDLRYGTSPYDALVIVLECSPEIGSWLVINRGQELLIEDIP